MPDDEIRNQWITELLLSLEKHLSEAETRAEHELLDLIADVIKGSTFFVNEVSGERREWGQIKEIATVLDRRDLKDEVKEVV